MVGNDRRSSGTMNVRLDRVRAARRGRRQRSETLGSPSAAAGGRAERVCVWGAAPALLVRVEKLLHSKKSFPRG